LVHDLDAEGGRVSRPVDMYRRALEQDLSNLNLHSGSLPKVFPPIGILMSQEE